jgi:hypothetical protein
MSCDYCSSWLVLPKENPGGHLSGELERTQVDNAPGPLLAQHIALPMKAPQFAPKADRQAKAEEVDQEVILLGADG